MVFKIILEDAIIIYLNFIYFAKIINFQIQFTIFKHFL